MKVLLVLISLSISSCAIGLVHDGQVTGLVVGTTLRACNEIDNQPMCEEVTALPPLAR